MEMMSKDDGDQHQPIQSSENQASKGIQWSRLIEKDD